MKLSVSMITFILAFSGSTSFKSTTTMAMPLDLTDSSNLVERDSYMTNYDLESRSFGDGGDDLYERDIFDYEDIEARSFEESDLYERDTSIVDIEARQGAVTYRPNSSSRGGGEVGWAISNVIQAAEAEPGKRGDFVKAILDEQGKAHPGAQVITCHTKHDYKFNGNRGKDWDHSHKEFRKDATPGTIGFEIYWFKKGGWFENQGDGGWQNWGYTGSPKKQGDKKLIY